jgi:transposase
MANQSISMSKIRQIIRLHTQGTSKLRIAELTGVARNSLKKYIQKFIQSGLSYPELNELTDKDLDDLFVKPLEETISPKLKTLLDLFPKMDKELKQQGVTKMLLWEKYIKNDPDGFKLTQFKKYFRQWKDQVNPTMRMEHKAGDKMFVDFAGEKLSIVDKQTGEVQQVEVFVCILGASQLTYVEAVFSQQKEDFIGACQAALQYYGGVPAAIVPDNLKSAVIKSSKYEPTINETFVDFAEHYGTSILPARAYRPRDKALVENAVRITYTRIYAKLRDKTFYNLEDLNQAIKEALEEHNNYLLRGRNYSRRAQFEEIERHTLQPLPLLPYEFKNQRYVTVMKNGHVCLNIDKHYYSVPYRFIGKKVKLMYSRKSVEIFYHYECIASHKRLISPYNYTTDNNHMASTHRFVADWSAERFLNWAEAIHKDVKLYISTILDKKQHPEQAYKSCVGILALAKKVGNERLIKACQRAIDFELYNYKIIQSILEKGLDYQTEEDEVKQLQMPLHGNIRGEDYFK